MIDFLIAILLIALGSAPAPRVDMRATSTPYIPPVVTPTPVPAPAPYPPPYPAPDRRVAAPAPLALQATVGRSEFVRGETLTISAYLYNDSAAPVIGQIWVAAPPGFVALTTQTITGTVAPGRALHADFRYRVASDAPKGLARFVVRSGGMVRVVVVRVGPIESRPPWRRVWLGIVRK